MFRTQIFIVEKKDTFAQKKRINSGNYNLSRAFDQGKKLLTILDRFRQLHKNSPPHLIVEGLFIYDKNV